MVEGRSNKNLLEDRFIQKILGEEGYNIKKAQIEMMASRGFTSPELLSNIKTQVTGTTMTHTDLLRHRFIDMKTREVRGQKKKVKSHPIHNRILFGHMNNVVRRLSFEFTEEAKKQIRQDLEQLKF